MTTLQAMRAYRTGLLVFKGLQERERLIRLYEQRIAGALASLGETAAARVLGGNLRKAAPKPGGEQTLTDDDIRRLTTALRAMDLAGIMAGVSQGAIQTGSESLRLDSPELQGLMQELGGRIVGITETTRQAVSQHIAVGFDRDYSIEQIVHGVSEDGFPPLKGLNAFSAQRARLIARTELTYAENKASVAQWRASDVVQKCRILDGPDCGWLHHDDPDKAHGSIRTLQEVEDHPLAHPNCVRVAVPIVEAPAERAPAPKPKPARRPRQPKLPPLPEDTQQSGYQQTGSAMFRDNPGLFATEREAQLAAHRWTEQWLESSTGTPESILLQQKVAAFMNDQRFGFGGYTTTWDDAAAREAYNLPAAVEAEAEAYVKAQYATTQRLLAGQPQTVYRGVSWDAGKEPREVRALRLDVDQSAATTVTMNPLSSFSRQQSIADGWSQEYGLDRQYVMSARVPAERVFLSVTGDAESTLFGGNLNVTITRVQ